ncbi:hypothetical protein [Streptomyces virginiae]|uniref:hypothetical protein n=1 Tax=Streptomyces virginiae TaxID=1961 RepID=UPI001900A8F4|nr:hypothetical protein [Streptomyces virginiae]
MSGLAGRLKGVRFTCSPDALKMLREHRKGESDLIERDSVFYLIAVCDMPGEVGQREPVRARRRGSRDRQHFHHFHRLPCRRAWSQPPPCTAAGLAQEAPGQGHLVREASLGEACAEARHAANVNRVVSKTIVSTPERTAPVSL